MKSSESLHRSLHILAVLIALAAGAQVAVALTGSDFEGNDGNLVADTTRDWADLIGSPVLLIGYDEPSGQTDDSFAQEKEDEPEPEIAVGSIPKQKSDLLRFYVAHERLGSAGSERDYLQVGWVRSNTLGSANMDFEFNQSDQIVEGGLTPVRTEGDLLITFGFSGGNQATLGLSRWTTTGPCEASNEGPCWGPIMPLAGIAEGAVNGTPVNDPIEQVTLAEQTFGEAIIDLTAAGVFDRDDCVTFGRAYVKSRSSESFTSSLKDFIKPIDVSVTNCATVTITKDAIPDGTQAFTFTPSPEIHPTDFDLVDDGDPATSPDSSRTFEGKFEGSFTVTEQIQAGWDLTDVRCTGAATPELDPQGNPTGRVDLQAAIGETVNCTFENTKRGGIVVVKNTVGADGTFSYTSSTLGGFDLTTTGGMASTSFDQLVPGTYDITETVPAGWDLVASCDDGSDPASIGLDPGETVTCTFTNTRRGKIVVVKNTLGGDGTFSYTSSTLGGFDLTTVGGTASTTFDLLLPGTYDISESVPQGWDLTSASCDDGSSPASIGVAPGETVTCTFQNTKRGKIVVVKNTIGGDGTFSYASSTLGGFDLTSSGGSASTTFDLLVPGSYDVSETVPTGWDLTSASCDDGSAPGSIGLDAGETVTCTFENTRRGKVVVVKNAIGGDGAFSFTSSTLGGFDLNTSSGTASTSFDLLVPGSYDVTETVPTGWDLTNVSCDDGSAPGSIGLDPGETVTCTFENTKRGGIVVVKNTIGAEGTFSYTSSTLGGFDLTTTGGTASTSFDLLVPGSYDVAETVPTGWDLTASSCDDGSSPGSIGLDPGETVTCTFTNTRRGKIVVVKNTAGGDGTFSFTSSTLGGFDLTTASGTASTTFDLLVPGSYDLSETVPTGWDLVASCDDGSAPGSIGLDPGETVTCTFTNTKRGSIVVVKNTIGGDGTFSFTSSTLGGFDLTTSGGTASTTFDLLVPGGYDVTETVPTGWDLTGSSCDDGSSPGSIGLDPGETVTCTFTNTKRGRITVVKNTTGGDGTFSFTSSTLGGFDLTTTGGTASRLFDLLLPGTYDVTEQVPEGWDLTGASCDDGSSPGSIGLAPGESVTCTFENVKRGKIFVDKVVLDASNPSFVASEWPFEFDPSYGPVFWLQHGQSDESDFLPGNQSYTVTENPPRAWHVTHSCLYPDGSTTNGGASASIDLPAGAEVYCTFFNEARIHPGSSGFWRNWSNHYNSSEFDSVLAEGLTGSPVYSDLFDGGGNLLPQAADWVDQIYDSGGGPIDQALLRELTSTLLNLAVSKSEDPAIRALQKNDDICRDCLLDLSSVPGGDALIEQWAPCAQPGQLIIQDVIDVAEATWTGSLPGNWQFGLLSESERGVLAQILGGINSGTVVRVDIGSLATNPTCLRLPGGVPEKTTSFRDDDGDGWGQTAETLLTCGPGTPAGYSSLSGDCDDANALINPGQAEVCDYTDNNCDGGIDEGVGTTWYADVDLDGYGRWATPVTVCDTAPAGYVATPGDCNDADAAIHPGAPEVCDYTDNNCNWQIDEGVHFMQYTDSDHDGYGVEPGVATCDAPESFGFASIGGDCNDSNPLVHPDALERCNSVDDNCDGMMDEDTMGEDTDGDGVHNLCDSCPMDWNPNQGDGDKDGLGGPCDNCAGLRNPAQSDFDADGEGDVCDLDDGITSIYFEVRHRVNWDAENGLTPWTLYRGDMQVLRLTGVYTQQPGSNETAGTSCGLTDPRARDEFVPKPGNVAFYLVTGMDGVAESDLGEDGSGTLRPNTNPCP